MDRGGRADLRAVLGFNPEKFWDNWTEPNFRGVPSTEFEYLANFFPCGCSLSCCYLCFARLSYSSTRFRAHLLCHKLISIFPVELVWIVGDVLLWFVEFLPCPNTWGGTIVFGGVHHLDGGPCPRPQRVSRCLGFSGNIGEKTARRW